MEKHLEVNPNGDTGISENELERRKAIKKMQEEHKGHESMHAEMLLIFLATLCVAQIILVQWKNRHPKSYNIATLFGMWLIPILYAMNKFWLRFILIWLLYTIVTSFIVFKASRKPLSGTTPRLVYRWFLVLFRVSYGVGVAGYIALMLTFFGINLLLLISPEKAIDFGVLLLFYGLYYGIVSRDLAEICSETMASTIGFYTKSGVPTKHLREDVCAICGLEILPGDPDDISIEKASQLSCDHRFHESCIRGWCIVGKKQTCPYCKEKVDLKRMFPSPWERPHIMYGQLLDWIRYLVAWQPVIVLVVQAINWSLGLK